MAFNRQFAYPWLAGRVEPQNDLFNPMQRGGVLDQSEAEPPWSGEEPQTPRSSTPTLAEPASPTAWWIDNSPISPVDPWHTGQDPWAQSAATSPRSFDAMTSRAQHCRIEPCDVFGAEVADLVTSEDRVRVCVPCVRRRLGAILTPEGPSAPASERPSGCVACGCTSSVAGSQRVRLGGALMWRDYGDSFVGSFPSGGAGGQQWPGGPIHVPGQGAEQLPSRRLRDQGRKLQALAEWRGDVEGCRGRLLSGWRALAGGDHRASYRDASPGDGRHCGSAPCRGTGGAGRRCKSSTTPCPPLRSSRLSTTRFGVRRKSDSAL